MIRRVLGREEKDLHREHRERRGHRAERNRQRAFQTICGAKDQEDGMDSTDIKEIVKEKYGQAALRGKSGSCCGTADSSGSSCDPITSNLYDATQMQQVPGEALQASLGCGNPTALAKLNPGEVVLDLGSGGGIDVLLSAKRVGPTGKAYGLDMTDEMLALANENKRKAGAENVEFLKGEIEPTGIYRVEDAREFLSEKGLDVDALAPQADGKFMSAFVRATKAKSAKTTEACCAPTCCK